VPGSDREDRFSRALTITDRKENLPMPLLILLLACLTAGPALGAKERPFIDGPGSVVPSSVQEREPWREGSVTLPPWPRDADLIEFELDAASPFRYYIDARSLTIGGDGVVRYTLVAESAGGARNVSFEGLRCTPGGELQIYAYGSGGELRPLPEADWAPIRDRAGDRLHEELHGHFLCGPLTFQPRPKKDILRALKGQIAERDNAGFLPD
jgi:hypothetical protein